MKSKTEALSLLNANNESFRQPSLDLHIARTYLAAVDPEIAKRPWRVPMEEIAKLIPKRQWPAVRYKEKTAITWNEHFRILEQEKTRSGKAYQLAWHLGASQSPCWKRQTSIGKRKS